jgi:hypothetical protein
LITAFQISLHFYKPATGGLTKPQTTFSQTKPLLKQRVSPASGENWQLP